LPYGPKGVALAYSVAMTLWVVPHIAWCIRGTPISCREILLVVSRPALSGITAGALAFGVQLFVGHWLTPLPRLLLGCTILLAAYAGMLLYAMGQRTFYLDLVRSLRRRPSVEESVLAS